MATSDGPDAAKAKAITSGSMTGRDADPPTILAPHAAGNSRRQEWSIDRQTTVGGDLESTGGTMIGSRGVQEVRVPGAHGALLPPSVQAMPHITPKGHGASTGRVGHHSQVGAGRESTPEDSHHLLRE
eukprot:CAMPEP_0204342794 /NCGR_PEP_ID=MMETSP0469-20131031/24406_1 /ASSEMBLY_ACC=CAM_ASM_000384 /TAXON_ID=2969 /ORGANISM="Oxyrrhis marina" /LENGTH=127 /DNA_ID=CAMNT_0051327777 /DNA_START=513 /DNA_END=895 /DNA_ORIENTATION=+